MNLRRLGVPPSTRDVESCRGLAGALFAMSRAAATTSGSSTSNIDTLRQYYLEIISYFAKFHYVSFKHRSAEREVFESAAADISAAPWIGRGPEELGIVKEVLAQLLAAGALVLTDAAGFVATLQHEGRQDSDIARFDPAFAAEIEEEWRTESPPGDYVVHLAPNFPPPLSAFQAIADQSRRSGLGEFRTRQALQVVEGWSASSKDISESIIATLRHYNDLHGVTQEGKRVVIKIAQYHGRTWFGDDQSTKSVLERILQGSGISPGQVTVRALLVDPRAEDPLLEGASVVRAVWARRGGTESMLARTPFAMSRQLRDRFVLKRVRKNEHGLFRGVLIEIDGSLVFASQVVWRFGRDRATYGVATRLGPASNAAMMLNAYFDRVFEAYAPTIGFGQKLTYWCRHSVIPIIAIACMVGMVWLDQSFKWGGVGASLASLILIPFSRLDKLLDRPAKWMDGEPD